MTCGEGRTPVKHERNYTVRRADAVQITAFVICTAFCRNRNLRNQNEQCFGFYSRGRALGCGRPGCSDHRGAVRKKTGESQDGSYGMEGMCLGMCLGTAIGTAPGNNTGIGISLGMLIGLAIGPRVHKEDSEA